MANGKPSLGRRDTMWTERNRSNASWRKSSYSATESHCVEVAELGRERAIRDTKHRELGALFFSAGEWRSFLDTAKADLR